MGMRQIVDLWGEAAIKHAEKHGLAVFKYLGKKDPAVLLSAEEARKEDPKLIFIEVIRAADPADKGMSIDEFLTRRTVTCRELVNYNDCSHPTVRAMTELEAQGRRREPLTKPYLKEKHHGS